MATWNDLPLELQEETLGYCLLRDEDYAVRDYIDSTIQNGSDLSSFRWLIRIHARKETAICEKLFTISTATSRALVPALKWYIKDFYEHRKDLAIRIRELQKDPIAQLSGYWSSCCWECDMLRHEFMLKEWDNCMRKREGYALRLLKRFTEA